MPREHGESGEFVETVTLDDVLGVFDHVDGPVVLSADVADTLGCTTETARRKLQRLHDRGDLDRRKVARRVLYWRGDEQTPSERQETGESTAQSDDGRDMEIDTDAGGSGEYADVNAHAVALVEAADGHVPPSKIQTHVADRLSINPSSWWKRHGREALEEAGAGYTHNKGWRLDQDADTDPLDESGPYDPTDEFDA